MPQVVYRRTPTGHERLDLPDSRAKVVGRVRWGRADVLFTPAFWAAQVFVVGGVSATEPHRLGSNFREEVVACLLCTHGVPSEVGLSAFRLLRDNGLLEPTNACLTSIETTLRRPMCLGSREVRYRFARQKAKAVYQAIRLVGASPPTPVSRDLRGFLQTIHGVGPKVASWIARNWLLAADLAVIDIHIYRAGIYAGFLEPTSSISRDYYTLERQYLDFAEALGVHPVALDDVIWANMRLASALKLL